MVKKTPPSGSCRNLSVVRALAYLPFVFEPSQRAMEMFIAFQERGISPKQEGAQDYSDFLELCQGFRLASGAQERMWLEGHFSGEYPLFSLIGDYISDWLEHPERRPKKGIPYNDAVKLLYILRGGPPKNSSLVLEEA